MRPQQETLPLNFDPSICTDSITIWCFASIGFSDSPPGISTRPGFMLRPPCQYCLSSLPLDIRTVISQVGKWPSTLCAMNIELAMYAVNGELHGCRTRLQYNVVMIIRKRFIAMTTNCGGEAFAIDQFTAFIEQISTQYCCLCVCGVYSRAFARRL